MRSSSVSSFVAKALDDDPSLGTFVHRHYARLKPLHVRGDPTDAVIEKLIAEFGLVGARGRPASPALYRRAWAEMAEQKKGEAEERGRRREAKDDWRDALVEAPSAAAHRMVPDNAEHAEVNPDSTASDRGRGSDPLATLDAFVARHLASLSAAPARRA